MLLAIRPTRLLTGLASLLAATALLGAPAGAQNRYDDRPDARDRYEEDDRYDSRRPADDRGRYDERDRYDDRDRYEDRYAGRDRGEEDDDPAQSFEELDRYGRWINHADYGRVWMPDVDQDWRPYTRGHWVWTDEHGWYWDSEEAFGWATFHYGRWHFDNYDGWVWVPGNVWGPAWVAWREGDEFMGWAPLPPDAYWYADRGLVVSSSFYTSPRYAPFWIFVSPRYMTSPGLHRHVAPRSQSAMFFGRTEPRRDAYRSTNRGIVNGGISVRNVERYSGRPVPTVRINAVASLRDQGARSGNAQTVNVYRPQRLEQARPDRWRSTSTRPDDSGARRPDVGGRAGVPSSPRSDTRSGREPTYQGPPREGARGDRNDMRPAQPESMQRGGNRDAPRGADGRPPRDAGRDAGGQPPHRNQGQPAQGQQPQQKGEPRREPPQPGPRG